MAVINDGRLGTLLALLGIAGAATVRSRGSRGLVRGGRKDLRLELPPDYHLFDRSLPRLVGSIKSKESTFDRHVRYMLVWMPPNKVEPDPTTARAVSFSGPLGLGRYVVFGLDENTLVVHHGAVDRGQISRRSLNWEKKVHRAIEPTDLPEAIQDWLREFLEARAEWQAGSLSDGGNLNVRSGRRGSRGLIRRGEISERVREHEQGEFFTDFGESIKLTDTTFYGDLTVPRYGVWSSKGRRKPEVVDLDDDLEALRRRHGDLPFQNLGPDGSRGVVRGSRPVPVSASINDNQEYRFYVLYRPLHDPSGSLTESLKKHAIIRGWGDCIDSGWEHAIDAQEQLRAARKETPGRGALFVLSRRRLELIGFSPSDDTNWRHAGSRGVVRSAHRPPPRREGTIEIPSKILAMCNKLLRKQRALGYNDHEIIENWITEFPSTGFEAHLEFVNGKSVNGKSDPYVRLTLVDINGVPLASTHCTPSRLEGHYAVHYQSVAYFVKVVAAPEEGSRGVVRRGGPSLIQQTVTLTVPGGTCVAANQLLQLKRGVNGYEQDETIQEWTVSFSLVLHATIRLVNKINGPFIEATLFEHDGNGWLAIVVLERTGAPLRGTYSFPEINGSPPRQYTVVIAEGPNE